MKYTNKWLLALLPATLLTSCAEDVFEQYQVEEPASFAELKYLNNYNVLKDYATSASVKIGAEVDAAAYNNQGALFGVATTNFNEVSGGASLYHSSVVRDNGGVNIGNFADMVKKATEAGQSVFGSALLTNTANNVQYLGTKGILAAHPDPNGGAIPTEMKWVELITNGDCEGDDVACFFSKENQGNPHGSELVAGQGKDGSKGIVLKATAKAKDPWDNQFFIKVTEPLPAGTKFKVSIDIKASTATTGIGTQEHGATPGSYQHYAFIGSPSFTTEWQTYTNEGTVTSADCQIIAFNLNDFADANTYYFDNISFLAEVEREADPFYWENVVTNGNCEEENVACFFETVAQKGPSPASITKGAGKDGSNCIVVKATAKVKQDWDNQFFIRFTEPLPAGTKCKFSMDIKADTETGGIDTQEHGEPGGYQHWAFIGTPAFKTDWQSYTWEGTTTSAGVQTIAFNLNKFADANTYYFDNIVMEVEKERHFGGLPLTAEEKYDTVNYALKNYIKNMMEASEGKVTAWDVLCNVLSDDGSAIREVKEEKTDFNWSEYLGEEDFARLAVKYAREYFVAAGGNAADLKLFISESGLDNDAKLNGLKTWLGKWEADNTTKIDGISTFINAEFNENADAQKANEEKITKLFNSLKETGRLVRISGFNIKYIDASNVTLNAAAMTVDQGKKMGDFYKFIIKKYLEIIPANQRYGIFVSNITDNGDEPNGLWTGKYSRKPQYGGFAEGLQ